MGSGVPPPGGFCTMKTAREPRMKRRRNTEIDLCSNPWLIVLPAVYLSLFASPAWVLECDVLHHFATLFHSFCGTLLRSPSGIG